LQVIKGIGNGQERSIANATLHYQEFRKKDEDNFILCPSVPLSLYLTRVGILHCREGKTWGTRNWTLDKGGKPYKIILSW
jgi:hypothetical protein